MGLAGQNPRYSFGTKLASNSNNNNDNEQQWQFWQQNAVVVNEIDFLVCLVDSKAFISSLLCSASLGVAVSLSDPLLWLLSTHFCHYITRLCSLSEFSRPLFLCRCFSTTREQWDWLRWSANTNKQRYLCVVVVIFVALLLCSVVVFVCVRAVLQFHWKLAQDITIITG